MYRKAEPKGSDPECQHPDKRFTGSLYDGPAGRKSYVYYSCPDCKARWKEEVEREVEPVPCTCGPDEACGDPCSYEPKGGLEAAEQEHKQLMADAQDWAVSKETPIEPPLTPEEEEQAPEDRCTCGGAHPDGDCTLCLCGCDRSQHSVALFRACNGCGCLRFRPQGEGPPPQPERRPPLLVAYSVQGHLYEVALPGDASVRAVDGALVIQHALGPVAGIVQVLPVINKESA